MGACTAAGNLAMVVEFMPRGSVYDRLHDEKIKLGNMIRFSLYSSGLQTRLLFGKDTALGMSWLHGCNPPFLHLDLKTQNLLV
jgi:serine/threonine protein kinase